jgi:hypothetical protein
LRQLQLSSRAQGTCKDETRSMPMFRVLAVAFIVTIATGGFVTLPCREREVSAPQELSGRCDRRPPRGHRRTAKHTVCTG